MGKSHKGCSILIWIAISIQITSASDAFGPAPKAIKGPNAENYHAVFRDVGKYAAHTTDVNIRVPFDFGTLSSNVQLEYNRVKEWEAKSQYYKDIIHNICQIGQQELFETQQKLSDHLTFLPKSNPTTPADSREKRFLGVVVATAALGLAGANRYAITNMEHQMSQMKDKTDLMLKIEHLHENHLKHIDERQERADKLFDEMLHHNVAAS